MPDRARADRHHPPPGGGLVGSDRLEDARALLALVRRGEAEDGEPLGESRMRWALPRQERDGRR
jgi:hypothetical protein